jgi:branched-chain amino acid transport system permease protein
MEPLTPTRGRWPGWVLHAVLAALILLGPGVMSRVISGITSFVTWPLTQELRFADNRFEIFNTELLFIYLIAAIGLNLLKQAGLLSLGVSALFAIGAYCVAIGTATLGWSFWLAIVVAILLSVVVGYVLGFPAIRLGLFTFAMVTVGYAFVTESLAQEWRGITGGGDGIHGVRYPEPFGELESYYWLVVIVLVISYVLAHNLLRSPFGRESIAIAQNPVAAQSLGVDDYRVKLRTFAISSVFAAVAGALYAPLLGFVAPDSAAVHLAILLVLMVLIGGAGTVAGPIIGTLLLFRIPIEIERVTNRPGAWSLLVYGVVLILSVHFVPRGLMSGWWWFRARLPESVRRRIDPKPLVASGELMLADMVTAVPVGEEAVLEASDILKTYTGVRAVDGLGLQVRPGMVHALIGPNGSGKTTFLNLLSGYITPEEGAIHLFGEDVTNARAHKRARAGIGRTFQTPFVFEGVTCLENVLVALDRHRQRPLTGYAIREPGARREEREQCQRAVDLLTAVGLGPRIEVAAAQLTPGERRLLELARVLALNPNVVLLDEPAAGLSAEEIGHLEEALRTMRDAGIGLLLVEHHVDFVMRLADVVTVIDYGKQIAHGNPAEVRNDPAVISAYLGQPQEKERATAGSELSDAEPLDRGPSREEE